HFLKNTRFARSSYAALLNYAASYAVVYMLSLYLQSIGQLSATEAGFIMLFQSLVQVIFTPIAGKLADKIDPKYLATAGMILSVGGLVLLSGIGLSGAEARGYITVIQILIGLGMALFSAPNTATIMSSVPKSEYSTASGIISVVRQYGMLISMAICMAAISLIVGSSELLNEAMYADFAHALKVSMLICTGLGVVGAILSWFRGPVPKIDEIDGEETA
ncbi:MAG TPA: MFS transporter, partial [Methanocorpusculum sp.]|nr:MFS transporter [Methanocorpusculum sp.]